MTASHSWCKCALEIQMILLSLLCCSCPMDHSLSHSIASIFIFLIVCLALGSNVLLSMLLAHSFYGLLLCTLFQMRLSPIIILSDIDMLLHHYFVSMNFPIRLWNLVFRIFFLPLYNILRIFLSIIAQILWTMACPMLF